VAGIWIMWTFLGTEITGTASPYQKQNLGIADDLASNGCLTPILVVASNLGHSDSRMCEQYHGPLTDDYQDTSIEAGAPTFGVIPESNVVSFKGAK
jgi:hypothetical protein